MSRTSSMSTPERTAWYCDRFEKYHPDWAPTNRRALVFGVDGLPYSIRLRAGAKGVKSALREAQGYKTAADEDMEVLDQVHRFSGDPLQPFDPEILKSDAVTEVIARRLLRRTCLLRREWPDKRDLEVELSPIRQTVRDISPQMLLPEWVKMQKGAAAERAFWLNQIVQVEGCPEIEAARIPNVIVD